jgi:hypothetical protein
MSGFVRAQKDFGALLSQPRWPALACFGLLWQYLEKFRSLPPMPCLEMSAFVRFPKDFADLFRYGSTFAIFPFVLHAVSLAASRSDFLFFSSPFL